MKQMPDPHEGKGRRVLVAMSGGVDSSVTAALLKQKGYDVIGATMQIWPASLPATEREGGCCSISAVNDARRVADRLDIPYYVLNFQDMFETEVIKYFCQEYANGRTPNPCIKCNTKVKFEALLRKAFELDAEFLATGHYSGIEWNESFGRYLLTVAADPRKDQSYALYQMTQHQLAHTLMPLGGYSKDQTRQIAARLGLSVADKPDSQEICFVPDNDYRSFLEKYSPESVRPGPIVDLDGKVLGRHNGISSFTIGQRKGLKISSDRPLFVIRIDSKKNEVVVGDSEHLLRSRLVAEKVNFIYMDRLDAPMEVDAKIRYNSPREPAIIRPAESGKVEVEFKSPQRAVTPGQAVVFYKDRYVVGGGTISD